MRRKGIFATIVIALSSVITVTVFDSISDFSTNFYLKTAASNRNDESIVMSALSAQIILALLSLGSAGDTLKELNSGLRLADVAFTKTQYAPAIQSLSTTNGIVLKLGNLVCVKEGLSLTADFKQSAATFLSDVVNVDFSKSADAAKFINNWVESKTNNKIKDLILPSSLNAATALVLVNAIYFKGNWEKKFDEKKTTQKDFYKNPDNVIKVDMMELYHEFNYADIDDDLNVKVLEMFYEKREVSMIILLPNENNNLSDFEQKLLKINLQTDVFSKLQPRNLTVNLPKFKIETKIDLKEVLPKLGINSIFDSSKSDLNGILQYPSQLYVTDAIQKAYIEVNEEGTQAAAATALILGYSLPPSFNANRPFLFLLKKVTGEILFTGRYYGIPSTINPISNPTVPPIFKDFPLNGWPSWIKRWPRLNQKSRKLRKNTN